MRRIKEVLRLKYEMGLNDRQVASSVRLARSTVQDYVQRVAASGLNPQQLCALGDEELDRRLFPPREQRNTARPLPDWEAIERELRRRGVRCGCCGRSMSTGSRTGTRYTQFLRHLRAWQKVSRPPTMRQLHRAGEALEVDYAGMTLTVMDMGLPREAQVFVACLPCSNLVYAETTWTQGQEDWLGSHVRALTAIGGCPEKLVPDNLKSGVTDAWYYDPVLNRAYYELAQHYGIAIVPARVRRPRDKSSVESAVKHVERPSVPMTVRQIPPGSLPLREQENVSWSCPTQTRRRWPPLAPARRKAVGRRSCRRQRRPIPNCLSVPGAARSRPRRNCASCRRPTGRPARARSARCCAGKVSTRRL